MTNTTMATCPTCNGTTRASAANMVAKTYHAGYDSTTDTVPCNNCRSKGTVRVNTQGAPCVHTYERQAVFGYCLNRYTCTGCGDNYVWDSGD